MKMLSILVVSLLALSATVQASHELIKQPVVAEAKAHYDMHDLKHWLIGYPQVNLSVTDNGLATVTGHVEASSEVDVILNQVKKTAGIRRVVNLMNID